VVLTNGTLEEHQGSNPNTGWTTLTGGAAQVQMGVNAAGQATAFVLFSNGNLYEYDNGSYYGIAASGVSHFAASQSAADTVDVVFGNVLYQWQRSTGLTGITTGVSQVQAGVDSSGHASAFILFTNGNLYEYDNGTYSGIAASGVTSFSASQANADTVDVIFGATLYQWQRGTGFTGIAGGVSQAQAGVGAGGEPTVFVLLTTGDLYEYDSGIFHGVIGGGATSVFAGAAHSPDTAFMLLFGNSLYEYQRSVGFTGLIGGVSSFAGR
jgi:hypothetical protein